MSVDYLVYVSQARAGLSDSELESILAQSQDYNSAHSVTGLLLYVRRSQADGGSFMQLLEGDGAELERLRQRIFDDPRHHTKIVIEKGTKPERDFSDWSMAFKNVPQDSLATYPAFKDLGEAHFMELCRNGDVAGACEFLVEFWNDAD
jgi:hypothetical protein